MNDAFLVLDVNRLLDDSKVGNAAAGKLAGNFEAAKKRRQVLTKRLEAAKGSGQAKAEEELRTFDAEETRLLEKARADLRTALLMRAQPHVIRLLKARGAGAVVRAEELVVFKRELDITAEVMAAVDNEGDLKL